MAYVINPDGTVSLIEVEYDSAGNIHPKRVSNIEEDLGAGGHSGLDWQHSNSAYSSKKKKKKKLDSKTVSISGEHEQMPKQETPVHVETAVPNNGEVNQGPVHIPRFLTKQSIDKYFDRRKMALKPVPMKVYVYAKSILKYNLWDYFVKRYDEHNQYLGKLQVLLDEGIGHEKKRKKNKAKKVPRTESKKNTIGDIAKITSLSHHSTDSSEFGGNGIVRKGRTPQYGYARDRYGRIQERDHYNEEKRNEFYQSSKHQNNYDYSNYDAEEDHDSYYENKGYD